MGYDDVLIRDAANFSLGRSLFWDDLWELNHGQTS